jgi:hypothetical protein
MGKAGHDLLCLVCSVRFRRHKENMAPVPKVHDKPAVPVLVDVTWVLFPVWMDEAAKQHIVIEGEGARAGCSG